MKRTLWLAAILCLCAVILVGCGGAKLPEVITEPTIAITEEGAASVWQIGHFDKDYYNLSELTSMAVDEAAKFSGSRGKEGAAVVDKVELLQDGSSRVVVAYQFDSCESCGDFFGNALFFGTVSEAIQKGFGTDVIMRSVKDNTLFTEAQLREAADKYLVITDIKANIYCPRAVTHVSNGALSNDDGSINPSGVEGLVYILLK